jgi:hypothetical protein
MMTLESLVLLHRVQGISGGARCSLQLIDRPPIQTASSECTLEYPHLKYELEIYVRQPHAMEGANGSHMFERNTSRAWELETPNPLANATASQLLLPSTVNLCAAAHPSMQRTQTHLPLLSRMALPGAALEAACSK